MIFTIKVKLVNRKKPSSDWEAHFEIPSNLDLEDFHLILQSSLAFDNDHLYEFYIANTERGLAIAQFECDNDLIVDTSISDFIVKSKGKKAFYLFDYGDCWLFRISNSRKKPFLPIAGIEYPRVISEVGKKPDQYPNWDE